MLYLSYGVLAGIGIGMGYIVPVATLIKWFPDKRGFITGIAVTGFGGGALIAAPVAKSIINGPGPFTAFLVLGLIYIVGVVVAASFMKNPPEDWKPEGFEPDEDLTKDRSGSTSSSPRRSGAGSGTRCGASSSST